MDELKPCLICKNGSPHSRYGATWTRVECPCCGLYEFADSPAVLSFRSDLADDASARAALSYRIKQMSLRSSVARLTDDLLARACENPSFPSPAEQADNLILYLGDVLEAPGTTKQLAHFQWAAAIGARFAAGAQFVIEALVADDLVRTNRVRDAPSLELTFDGWKRHADLRHARVSSRKAFMAMPFGHQDLDRWFAGFVKPAVARAGFELVRVDDDPKTGLIDDRIRVGILTSRFLVAELTHANAGAYWEAGFAEGLGRPVLYTCERSFFEERGTHFDTRNRQTVIWEADRLGEAAEKVKATIRATLPDEAIMADEEDKFAPGESRPS